ncbi:HEAT repeat domain-containing protein [Alienimonas californiensis]|uniref:HEAT repeat protein n=1 Tax=Alienimonas californiensis TaxID=2527989 RepID=A0A517PFE9_9PLAN|nr:HEAT repeat domain-containing protein [Alienimonas californiensis]QDT18089.1 hypothetical protein CA12_42280 [Alienimonas californiensis]
MFGLFAPRPPLETLEQAWIERRLGDVARQFGPERLGLGDAPAEGQLKPSEAMGGTRSTEDVDRLFARLVDRLGPAPVTPTLAWYDGDAHLSTDKNAIPVPRSAIADPPTLGAALVRGACRRMHFGEGEADLRAVDLVATALGCGLFLCLADAPEAAAPGDRGLTSREIGYALALLWHVRQEAGGASSDPPWLGELRGDAAAAVTGGLKYLRKAGDARFTAASLRDSSPPTEAAVRKELHHKRPARRLAAVWDAAQLPDRESRTPGVESATLLGLLETLHDREPAVRAASAEALGRLCPNAAADRETWDRVLLGLIGATEDTLAAVRAAALRGLAAAPDLGEAEAAREELDRVVLAGLAARTPAVRSAAAAVATRLPPVPAEAGGLREEPFAPAVLKALVGALVRCDDAEAAGHVATLRALHPDPAALAEERVDDDELLSRVLDALGDAPLAAPEPEPEPVGAAE